jgi:hypothetical protein
VSRHLLGVGHKTTALDAAHHLPLDLEPEGSLRAVEPTSAGILRKSGTSTLTVDLALPLVHVVRELGALYEGFSTGRPCALPALPIQYADYAAWQRRALSGDVLDAQLAYWKEQLAGAPPALELPTDRPRPAVQTYRGAALPIALSPELSASLVALSRREGVTLFMTLLAALQSLLQRYTGQDDIVVGSPIAGRTQVETEGLIGFFVNTLVLRTDLSKKPSVKELLQRVRQVTLGAYAHQDVPFEKLVEELAPARDLSRSPFFQAMLVLQNAPLPALALGELELAMLDVEQTTAKFDLTLSLRETEDGLRGALEYNADLFDPDTIERFIGHYHRLLEGMVLEGMVAEPVRPVAELPLLTAAERHQVLVTWNDTAVPYPHDRCVHELFEEQVDRTPDAVALVFEEQRLTYRELDERSNQLAHHLRSLGVGPTSWSTSSWSARSRWSWPSTASSRRAAPTCPSIPTTPLSASRSWCTTAEPR